MKRDESYDDFITRCHCIVERFMESDIIIPSPPEDLPVLADRMDKSVFKTPEPDQDRLTAVERSKIIGEERERLDYSTSMARHNIGTATPEDYEILDQIERNIEAALERARGAKKRQREEDQV
jgi:hypothetical protein